MDLVRFEPAMFESYERVNRMFAERVMAASDAEDAIWVHDYHFMTMGAHLRTLGAKQRIGFFLHIPFPVPEVFSALPHYQEILKALCAYDVIGFQTDGDVEAFLRCVKEFGHGRKVKSKTENIYDVQAYGQRFKAGRFSISIDTNDLMLAADKAELSPTTLRLRASLDGRPMIIGVDRLDYTKGITHRVQSFHHMLQQSPEWLGKVSYIQITPPSRSEVEEYADIRHTLEGLAARVNGMNADIDWVPIRYINKSASVS
jgi:trehalose 6-phosphate synthase